MIPLIDYDYSEGEQGSAVMKFTEKNGLAFNQLAGSNAIVGLIHLDMKDHGLSGNVSVFDKKMALEGRK